LKKWQKAASAFLAAMMVTGLVAGCGSSDKKEADSNEIKIGALFELTGGVANYGKSTLSGVQLAVEDVNKTGGVLGKKVVLVVGDDKSEPSEAGNVATKLITQDKVKVLIGPATSGGVAACAPIAEANKIPHMAPVATAAGITVKDDGTVRPYAFRACFIDPFQGKIMAKFAVEDLKVKKAAIFNDASSDYSKGLATVFAETLKASGGEVVAQEAFLAKDVDFKSSLTKIKATNPEVLYVPAYYEEVSKIIKQARELGIDCPIIGSDGWDSSKLVEIAGAEALNNTYFCSAYSAQDQTPSVQDFIKSYKAKFNSDPDTFAIHAYDAALIVFNAMETAKTTDGEAVAKAMAETKDLPVATGTVSYDEYHNPISSAVIIENKDGKQMFLKKMTL
jgi:branched-chain amino acid transport system substrate-binding protein